jgi:hypothetical protein
MKISVLRNAAIVFSLLILVSGILNTTIAQEGFEEWKQNYLQEFQEFQNEYDKQFHKMLQEEWENLDVNLSADFYQKPKPKTTPTANDPDPEPKTNISLEEPSKSDTPTPDSKKNRKKTNKKRPPENRTAETASTSDFNGIAPPFEPNVKKAEVETQQMNFFDTPIQYRYYSAYKTEVEQPVDRETISEFWKHLSTKDYPSFLNQIKQVRSELLLNDYGYAQLLTNIGEQIYGADSPGATLFTWFMLTQSEYGTRIAYNDSDVYLLIKTSPGVFKTTYFTIKGTKYYALNLSGSNTNVPTELYTYKGDYPKSNQEELDLLFSQRPLFPQQQTTREFAFSYRDTSYNFEVPIDKQIINYFKDYPKAKLDLYFNSTMEGKTHEKLLSSLRPLLKNKSDVEKANILLSFIHDAFEYQTDQEQFNAEKKMFPAEMLYYPASDCDDRTILFTYLVKNLTDWDYVVLRYPGHLTPAIHFSSDTPQGRAIKYNGKSYYVTDPTYINAKAGMIMSKYRSNKPEVIDL